MIQRRRVSQNCFHKVTKKISKHQIKNQGTELNLFKTLTKMKQVMMRKLMPRGHQKLSLVSKAKKRLLLKGDYPFSDQTNTRESIRP